MVQMPIFFSNSGDETDYSAMGSVQRALFPDVYYILIFMSMVQQTTFC